MNTIQKYVLNSLFLRKQITEEKLAQALDTVLSDEPAIDSFLTVLVTDKIETEQNEKQVDTAITTSTERFTKNSRIKIQIYANKIGKLQAIVELAKVFKISKIKMKDLLDKNANGIFQGIIYIVIPQEIYDAFHTFPDVTEDLIRELSSYSWCDAELVEE